MLAALATIALFSFPFWGFPAACVIDGVRDDMRIKRSARAALADSVEMGADW